MMSSNSSMVEVISEMHIALQAAEKLLAQSDWHNFLKFYLGKLDGNQGYVRKVR